MSSTSAGDLSAILTAPDSPVQVAQQVSETCWAATPHVNWPTAARDLSTRWGGWWVPRLGGITSICGRRISYLVDPSQVDSLTKSQRIAQMLGLEPGWSHGSIAGSLLKWVDATDQPAKGLERQFGETCFGYRLALPSTTPAARLYDLKGCYYHLCRRLPSLYPYLCRGRLCWGHTSSDAWDRWQTVLGALAAHKPLRNSLWGVMLGSTHGRYGFVHGERKRFRAGAGPLRPAGIVVARTAYELTRAAALDTGALHAHTDSVLCPSGAEPTRWADLGFAYELQAHGEGHVLGPARYRCGPKATKLYSPRSTFFDPEIDRGLSGPPILSQWVA